MSLLFLHTNVLTTVSAQRWIEDQKSVYVSKKLKFFRLGHLQLFLDITRHQLS